MNDPVGLFKEEWINEEQAILLAMSMLECSREEALEAIKEIQGREPRLGAERTMMSAVMRRD